MTLFLYLSGYALFLVFMHSEIEQDNNKAGWLYYVLAVAFGSLSEGFFNSSRRARQE